MKEIFYLIILVFITTPENIKTQEINPLDFFPYHVGDIRQYIEIPSGQFYSIEITRIDTIDLYTHLIYYNNNEIATTKVLSDSAIVLVDPSMWIPYYKLCYPVGSFWIRDTTTSWWVYFRSQFISEVFNENRETREYYIYEYTTEPGDTNAMPVSVDYLVRGIGQYRNTWEGGEIILNGCIINGVQYGTIISVEDENQNSPFSQYILNNFPNPFNGQTTIHYYLPVSTVITLIVYDILGREIEKIIEGEEIAGHHYRAWQPNSESSGLYFVVMRTSDTQLIHKVLFLK